MNKIKTSLLLLIIIPIIGFSQNKKQTLSKKEQRKERPTYISVTTGMSLSNFRDFATSPLVYNGVSGYISLSHIKSDQQRESEIGFSYSSGIYNNIFNNHSTISKVRTASIYYSKLYQLSKLSSEKLNVKIGGLFNTTGNFRINGDLNNNAYGFEFSPTLMGSVKITKDISRKEDKNKKFLFIKYKLKQKTRDLAFRFNVGLINSSFRNGFVYSGQSGIINEPNVFDDYQFKLFSGFRMSSALDYTVSLKNKNKIQLSYLWGAYKTGGDLDKFEMAHHTIKFTLLFNTNNK